MNKQFDTSFLDNKDIVFIGKGREGKQFEQFIQALGTANSLRFVDESDGQDYLEKLRGLDLEKTRVYKTPGCPGRRVPVAYETSTRLFFYLVRQTKAKIIGITGTKGKTTTASLISHILASSFADVRLCGNVGIPMLRTLMTPVTDKTVFVVELSSYQLAELEQSPDIAVATNLFHDHVDYHGSLEVYWAAKKHIMVFQNEQGLFVYNGSTLELATWAQDATGRSIDGLADARAQELSLEHASLFGNHNLENARLAAVVCLEMGMDIVTIQKQIDLFVPVRHRLQIVANKNGVTFVDDAIASQPEAAIAGITAIEASKGPVGCLFLGGENRSYDFGSLAKRIIDSQIPCLVLFPESGELIYDAIREKAMNYKPEVFRTSAMREAVLWAAEHSPSNTYALLSCGSPSYSLWKDFEEKGNQFQAAVHSL
jgi:UDP-N-acetylmuramoyl-L-alanine---L-glutamate ligase